MAEVSGALSRDIVVVGASVAGLHAAHAVAKMGRGLSVMVIGERVRPRYNLPLADRTGLTGPTDLDSTTLRALSQLGSQGVDLRLGARASELDLANQRILVGNGSVSYRALVIACGCAPTIPALLTEESRVYTVGQREEVSALRAVLADPPWPSPSSERDWPVARRRRGSGARAARCRLSMARPSRWDVSAPSR